VREKPDARDETELERLDRNTVELLNELRVAATGIQVIFAFLLVVPFNNRFPKLTTFERDVYLVGLGAIAIAAILLIAPSVHHRLLFRQGEKEWLVTTGSRCMIIASVFLAAGISSIGLLVGDFVAGAATGIAMAVAAALLTLGIWFALPLRHQR
jgi:hypothetical protein